jgi:hypothetical protein
VAAVGEVEALIGKVRDRGLDTLYFEILPTVARVALEVRWDLPGHEEKREDYVAWVCEHAAKLKEALEAVLAGKARALSVPPIPDYGELELRDGYLRHRAEPLLLFGVHGRGPGNLVGRYFAPGDLMGFVSGVGGTRFDYHEQPIWEAYQKYPDTHRVWAGGPWCGHVIVDQWSIGGRTKGDCIICLESPRTRGAVVEYMRKKVPGLRDNPRVKFYSLDWEYAYICFCEQTLEMWRGWLAEKHKTIQVLNEVWGTEFRSFAEVTLPSIETEKEENRAKWYDFARFNCSRFTDYMLWARSQLRRVDPRGLTSTGAPFYMLAGQMGWAGIDEEALDRTVNDVVLNEAHASTITTDLLRSFPTEPKLLQDPEYHGDIAHILAHFLHGDGYVSMWWWPETLRPTPPSFYASDIGRSPHVRLEDVATCLRSALDARRLSGAIVRFHQQKEEVALLYSHDSMLQLAPELRNSRNVPHVFALRTLYDGTVYLDAPTRFVTERQIAEGRLQSLKLLILPGVEYQNRATQSGILDWVRGGGTLVLSPNNWLADEYARPADYLAGLGIRIEAMALPEVRVSEARPDIEQATGFIMGAISEVELEKVPKSSLRESREWSFARRGLGLVGWGVQQTLAVANPKASVIAAFADGRPAILRIPVGKGTVYYFATPLAAESWHRFFDALYDALRVTRLTRTLDAEGENFFGIDSRTVVADGGYLTYVINLLREAQEVTLLLPAGVSQVTNLSADEPMALPMDGRLHLRLGRFETVLLRLT